MDDVAYELCGREKGKEVTFGDLSAHIHPADTDRVIGFVKAAGAQRNADEKAAPPIEVFDWEENERAWRESVENSPLGNRERAALIGLYELRGRFVAHNEIKGAGPATCRSLEARGHVTLLI